MDSSPENNYPQLCFAVGLTCETCTADAARELARCCQGLRGKMVGQMFVQIYPNPACARMHAHFADAYREASHDRMVARPLVLAAVA
jgi:hypothetical protein